MLQLRSTRSRSPRKSPGVPSGLRVAGALVLAGAAGACGAEVCPSGTVEVSNSRSLWPRCVALVVGETEMGTGGGGDDGACDLDGVCDPDESLENCPKDCGVCGDGVVSGTEECDLGEGKNIGSSWMMTEPSPNACAPGCKLPVWCGDGIVQGVEECDEGAGNNADDKNCTSWCKVAVCGDGLVCSDPGCSAQEECDDGADSRDDRSCTATCRVATCGDGLVCTDVACGPEVCDNGPGGNVDYSPMEPMTPCNTSCTSTMVGFCGDGVLDMSREECDNGAMNVAYWEEKSPPPADACSTMCAKQVPWCDDGVVQEGVEECDDGDNGDALDGCHGCKEMRVIFVAQTGTKAGALGGLDGADALCKQFAVMAQTPQGQTLLKGAAGRTFRAWLSTHDDWPAKRFTKKAGGTYVGLDGAVIANGWADLTDGTLDSVIRHRIALVDEYKVSSLNQAWAILTHTNADGMSKEILRTTSPCKGWTDAAFGNTMAAYYGVASDKTDFTWSYAFGEGFQGLCASAVTMYCFED